MAHRIQDNMIAWKGQTPWHGLGTQVSADADGDTMLKTAKLDWRVQRRAIAMRNSEGSQDSMIVIPNMKAIVRQDTDQVFQIATDRYKPIQNQEIVDFFKEYCEAGHAILETVGGIDGGAKIWALAKLNGGSQAMIGGVDEVRGYMLLATSHDGSLQTVGKPTQTRVVCWNTLSAALGLAGDGSRLPARERNEFRMKHSTKWTNERKDEAKRIMGMAIESIKDMNKTAETLSKVTIDERGRIEFITRLMGGESILEQVVTDSAIKSEDSGSILDRVLNQSTASKISAQSSKDQSEDLNRVGKQILEAMLTSPGSDLPTAKDTLWGAVNGVTYFVDHERGRTQDSRLDQAWFGIGDRMKRDAVSVALEMAGTK